MLQHGWDLLDDHSPSPPDSVMCPRCWDCFPLFPRLGLKILLGGMVIKSLWGPLPRSPSPALVGPSGSQDYGYGWGLVPRLCRGQPGGEGHPASPSRARAGLCSPALHHCPASPGLRRLPPPDDPCPVSFALILSSLKLGALPPRSPHPHLPLLGSPCTDWTIPSLWSSRPLPVAGCLLGGVQSSPLCPRPLPGEAQGGDLCPP